MKFKFFAVAVLFCITVLAFSQESAKQIFSSPKLQTEITKHKTVAIIPFAASITYKRPPKNYDASAHAAEEKNLSTDLQNAMYT